MRPEETYGEEESALIVVPPAGEVGVNAVGTVGRHYG